MSERGRRRLGIESAMSKLDVSTIDERLRETILDRWLAGNSIHMLAEDYDFDDDEIRAIIMDRETWREREKHDAEAWEEIEAEGDRLRDRVRELEKVIAEAVEDALGGADD